MLQCSMAVIIWISIAILGNAPRAFEFFIAVQQTAWACFTITINYRLDNSINMSKLYLTDVLYSIFYHIDYVYYLCYLCH